MLHQRRWSVPTQGRGRPDSDSEIAVVLDFHLHASVPFGRQLFKHRFAEERRGRADIHFHHFDIRQEARLVDLVQLANELSHDVIFNSRCTWTHLIVSIYAL